MQRKVCGLTQPDNIEAVLGLGVDYVGFIFYSKSKRYAESPVLKKWVAEHQDLFADVAKVGVFVNAEVDYVLNTVHDYELDYVQLHGAESPGYCQELKLLWSVNTLRGAKIVKAFSVDQNFNFATTLAYASSCAFFVFDTGGQADHGGTGVKWDWDKLREYEGTTPFLLSGGIGPADAAKINVIDHQQLLGVDVNSRFEVSPGNKDVDALSVFLAELD
ncbi:phosphoribosylanthranilate isomerase [Neolewinella antarctica]|uniref:N-(5'-phosphoribosyl)anthranilate isomerase n=1 Tax=Neolewinella antarctica TaxID=442734 RepID=A0ABX0X949_9BACT|nr:phosphoribosylanthranilate isomerase [Neolewinella antarctica]NJC25307.1 phosphoribosylanthranilate isomerase [Neolewinella antarctica]